MQCKQSDEQWHSSVNAYVAKQKCFESGYDCDNCKTTCDLWKLVPASAGMKADSPCLD